MIAPARMAAYEILQAVSSGRSDLSTATNRARGALKDARDRALAFEIATGVQRWRLTLDYLVEHFARRPVTSLDPEVLDILRLAAYQLLYLSRVPVAAAVDDAVKMTRKVGKTSASGLVNAVLRALSRTRHALPLPPRPHDNDERAAIEYLSVSFSHPRWLAARWYGRLGLSGAAAWMAFNNRPAPLVLRANPIRTNVETLQRRLSQLGIPAERGRYAPDALVVQGNLSAELEEGSFVVQDEASQLITLLAGDQPGRNVLDTCASPGGKATALAAAVGDRGHVVACDVRYRRMRLLADTVQASGATNVKLVQADLMNDPPFAPVFNSVLVDAPCSGLGTLRRDPDIKWRRQASDLGPLASAQATLLRHAAKMVVPGGRLVYATCSSEPEENDEVVDAFLRERSDFAPVDARRVHLLMPHDVVDERGRLRTSPDCHGLECFFGAVLERSPHL
jgi:16S rRNA (cytosine967-C5)-methyltransferase